MRYRNVDGTHNLRDTGGYRVGNSTTRFDTLFRSDGLHRLSDAGKQAFTELGIRHVIDLRDDTEREVHPDALPDGVQLTPHSIFPSALSHIGEQLDVVSLTERIYHDYAPNTVAALNVIASTDEATLVHCTAGKDRTGAVIALTLTAVGVDRDDVFHDYAETETRLRGAWLDAQLRALDRLGYEVNDTVIGLLSGSPVEAIDAAMSRIDREYGSVETYLLRQGLDEATIERLATRLVS